jgi:adenylate cyclase
MRRLSFKSLRELWWAPLVCYGLSFLLYEVSFFRQLGWKTLDWRTEFRRAWQPPPDPRVAVVLFDDDTDTRLEPWPVDRAWHAQFMALLAQASPAVVSWDVIFDATGRTPEGDAEFARISAGARELGIKVISAAVTTNDPAGTVPGDDALTEPLRNVTGDIRGLHGDERGFLPYPELRAAAPYGFADTPPAADGVRRFIPLVVRAGEQVYPTLALQTLLEYFGVPRDQVRVVLGDAITFPAGGRERRLRIDERGEYLLNYRYDLNDFGADFPVYGYARLLIALNARHVEQNLAAPAPPDLAGRIVFVGQTVTGKADAGPTPLGGYSPLVFVHANLVCNVLMDDHAWRIPDAWVYVSLILLGWLGLLLLAERGVLILCGGALLGLVLWVSAAVWGWMFLSVWVPLLSPMTGFMAFQFIVIGRRFWQEQKAKLEIKGMFGAYVSPQLVERLVKAGRPPELGGVEEEITAYFSDIQSFSTFSEQLPPRRLVELMNEYLTACTDIVQAEGGTLDKYIGDAVVAMFGAPIALPDHAYRACLAAQRVQLRLAELREQWRREGERWPRVVREMQSRIGLNTGQCVIGNMGSRTRFNYTMMGDNVNLAARMESGAKSWGVYTMCTEATRAACERHGDNRLVFRPLGRIVVKGRTLPVPIHEIVGLTEHVTDATRECVALFTEGLDCYLRCDWDGAETRFKRSLALEPNQPGTTPGVTANPSSVYLGIVRHCREEPPPPKWDGVYIMREK